MFKELDATALLKMSFLVDKFDFASKKLIVGKETRVSMHDSITVFVSWN